MGFQYSVLLLSLPTGLSMQFAAQYNIIDVAAACLWVTLRKEMYTLSDIVIVYEGLLTPCLTSTISCDCCLALCGNCYSFALYFSGQSCKYIHMCATNDKQNRSILAHLCRSWPACTCVSMRVKKQRQQAFEPTYVSGKPG